MAKYKKGDKFVIEVKDVTSSYLSSDSLDLCSGEDNYYSIEGIDSKIWEHDLDNLIKYEESCNHSNPYDKGIAFAQETYRKLDNLTGFDLREIFGTEGGSVWKVIQKYSVVDIDDMISKYSPKFSAGDEFLMFVDDNHYEMLKAIITCADVDDTGHNVYYILYENGKTGSITTSETLRKYIYKRVDHRNIFQDRKFERLFHNS